MPPGTGAGSTDGRCFTGFVPAISPEAVKAKSVEFRNLRIHRRTDLSLDDLSRWLNPKRLRTNKRYRRWHAGPLARSPPCSPTGAWPASIEADQKSPVTGDCHARIRGTRRLPTPRATRLAWMRRRRRIR
jgi:hypothetical protein